MKRMAADLHIHTALSPCAEDEMTPPAIVARAVRKRLDMIAICDHNSAGNAAAVQEAARGSVAVLAGMEVTTAEEAHVVGLFPDVERAQSAAERIRAALPDAARGRSPLSRQRLLDAAGSVVGRERKLLAAAAALTLSDTVALIHAHGGLAIAAHVDRPSFSVFVQLGMWPESAGFDAVEVSTAAVASGRDKEFLTLGLPIVTSSDSHFLSSVGSSFTVFEMETPSLEELARAMKVGGIRRLGDA
jgi:predicted metal-dependent phosphoesterase TrpH